MYIYMTQNVIVLLDYLKPTLPFLFELVIFLKINSKYLQFISKKGLDQYLIPEIYMEFNQIYVIKMADKLVSLSTIKSYIP